MRRSLLVPVIAAALAGCAAPQYESMDESPPALAKMYQADDYSIPLTVARQLGKAHYPLTLDAIADAMDRYGGEAWTQIKYPETVGRGGMIFGSDMYISRDSMINVNWGNMPTQVAGVRKMFSMLEDIASSSEKGTMSIDGHEGEFISMSFNAKEQRELGLSAGAIYITNVNDGFYWITSFTNNPDRKLNDEMRIIKAMKLPQ